MKYHAGRDAGRQAPTLLIWRNYYTLDAEVEKGLHRIQIVTLNQHYIEHVSIDSDPICWASCSKHIKLLGLDV
jgi:hypothetical protein